MASEQGQLHIFFLPFMAPSHMIPAIDMARIFTTYGVRSTIVTTPANIAFFSETIENHNQKSDLKIDILTMKFPSLEAGLPEGVENVDSLVSIDLFPKFIYGIDLLQDPFENLLANFQPNCLVADFFINWANSSATKFGIPCLSFHGSCYFSQCIIDNILHLEPYKELSSDSETFVVPGDLPHEIKLAKSELSPTVKKEGPKHVIDRMEKRRDASKSSYGVIMNSFYELECDYVDYYDKFVGKKHWHIGPLSLYFNEEENVANRGGKTSSINVNECVRWLDEKEPNSVIYICFGSVRNVIEEQLNELAIALEGSELNFILVVKQGVLDGFEERVQGRGLIIRGWAPQSIILNHESTGAFVTHCGWNSILEGVIAGLPLMTWPQFAEQFINEKLVTDVLKIGVQAGAKIYPSMGNEITLIRKDKILRAMRRLMIGEEAQDMRKRAKELREMAKKAISQGGSSNVHLQALIEELKNYKK